MSTKKLYTCDLCGKEKESEFINREPEGWGIFEIKRRIRVKYCVATFPDYYDVCEDCIEKIGFVCDVNETWENLGEK